MTPASDFAPFDNPFSARRVRPGVLPYRFPPGGSLESILQRLQQHGWRGQITGPHGSGKSTLLASLLPAVQRTGRATHLITLHDGQRRLPPELQPTAELLPDTLVVVDGYEQLSFLSRTRLQRLCRRHAWGLLVTSHRSVGLPDILQTATDVGLAQSLVAQLLGEYDGLITPQEVAAQFAGQQGNLREVLFALYDLYEQRRPSRPAAL